MLIKVLESGVADSLQKLGFVYTTEQINNQTVYVFDYDESIINFFVENYESVQYVVSDSLVF